MSSRDSKHGNTQKPSRPERTTRGKRIELDEDEVAADGEFWDQQFFAEDAVDMDFKSDDEKEVEDVPDSDFDESEDEDDGEAGVEVAEKRKKSLKPPGAPASKPKKPKAPSAAPSTSAAAAAAAADDEESDMDEDLTPEEAVAAAAAAAAARKLEAQLAKEKFDAPSLRRSTVSRSAEAVKERTVKEKKTRVRPKSGTSNSGWKPLSQSDLLSEAANTEVSNMLSLKTLLAREEEVRRKAMIVKHKHSGPIIRQHSKIVNGVEKTVWGCMQMPVMPRWLQPAVAPLPQPHNSRCAVTGKEALYRDPATKRCFSDASTFATLRGLPPPKTVTAAAAAAQHQPIWMQQLGHTQPHSLQRTQWQQQQQQQQQQQASTSQREQGQQSNSSQNPWQQPHQQQQQRQQSHSTWQHTPSQSSKGVNGQGQLAGSHAMPAYDSSSSSGGGGKRSCGGTTPGGARFGDKGPSMHVAPLPQSHDTMMSQLEGQPSHAGQTPGHGFIHPQALVAPTQTPQMMALLCDLHRSIAAAHG